jgi:aspartyl-tRNA(Asn)/glutamyl-tRNA(Gln) amidotransferase subunit A
MSEFAYGPTGHNAHHGPARNPWNPLHITGGSSSGSGAAVGARAVPAALGSDTGGSIRMPAHFCGVTGFKPTNNRVSRANAMPLSFTLDSVGPLARTAEDCALVMRLIAGADPLDPTTADAPKWDAKAAARPAKSLKVGIPDAYFGDDLAPDVAAAYDAAIKTMRRLGARVVKVKLPDQNPIMAAASIVIAVEAAACHAPWLRTRRADYGPQVGTRLENGLAYSAIEYLEALRFRGPALAAHLEALGDIDLMLIPACRMAAPTIAETDVGGGSTAERIIADLTRLMRPANFLGLPVMGLPAGRSTEGLPIGVQLVGRPFGEEAVAALGVAFQQATDHHRPVPSLP